MHNFDGLLTPEQANSTKNQIHNKPHELQQGAFKSLLTSAQDTKFAHDHCFAEIKSYDDFKIHVPIREYADFNNYWDLIAQQHSNVLWPGKPLFLATTSASTGYLKYIPVTKDSLSLFITMPLRAMMQYLYDTKDYSLLQHDFLHLTGSPSLKQVNNYPTGTISGITRQMLPQSLVRNSLPSKETLEIMQTQGWEAMFKQMAKEVSQRSISICTGLPSWMMQFFNACCDLGETTNLTTMLPNLKLLCTSGLSYKPYHDQIQRMFDHKITFREFYAASEGAFAYQDSIYDKSMLLNLADGIFFEFVELNRLHTDKPPRIMISDVKPDIAYVPIVSTRAGLWAYQMGDVIKFTSIKPYRIEFVGRTKHFISTSIESVYSKNVEDAMTEVASELGMRINNYTVAPNSFNEQQKPYYIWYIELEQSELINSKQLAFKLDYYLKHYSNSYANARQQSAVGSAKVFFVKPGGFLQLLKQKDKSSLQLKVPKLQNDREIADYLINNNLIIEQEPIETPITTLQLLLIFLVLR
jgi:hypothetical protein